MATHPEHVHDHACCAVEEDQVVEDSSFKPDDSQGVSETEYDFVEEPSHDFFCPVSLELLVEPCQTSCCGNHISKPAADRLIREKKPCPICKEKGFTAQTDKFFKRKFINTLKVRCPHKTSGCEWTGELRELSKHSTSCPKRPWTCQYCGFKETFDVGTNNHTPNCPQYPLPCPNQCEIGTVPRCDAERHLLVCPLQLVKCEFASAGCEVKVSRRDLARHMTENAQQHLMSATLLNLRLTRELHRKMEEKDQQIAELKQQLSEHEARVTGQTKGIAGKLEQQAKDFGSKLQQHNNDTSSLIKADFQHLTRNLDIKLQQQTKDFDTKLQQQIKSLDTKVQQQIKDLNTKQNGNLNAKLQQQTKDLDTKLLQQTRGIDTKLDSRLQQQTKSLDTKLQQRIKGLATEQTQDLASRIQKLDKCLDAKFQQTQQMAVGFETKVMKKFSSLEMHLIVGFREIQIKVDQDYRGGSYFYPVALNGYKFELCTFNVRRHLGAYLFPRNSDHLQWPVKGEVILIMLNQKGDHSHHVTRVAFENLRHTGWLVIKKDIFPLADLVYNAERNAEYINDNTIKFRIRVSLL